MWPKWWVLFQEHIECMRYSRRRRRVRKMEEETVVPAQRMLQSRIILQSGLMPIGNILTAWWNPTGDMDSLTSISASDLIWQMDTYYTISHEGCSRQWSVGRCHFEFRNETSSSEFPRSCTWSSSAAWICMLSLGCIALNSQENAITKSSICVWRRRN